MTNDYIAGVLQTIDSLTWKGRPAPRATFLRDRYQITPKELSALMEKGMVKVENGLVTLIKTPEVKSLLKQAKAS